MFIISRILLCTYDYHLVNKKLVYRHMGTSTTILKSEILNQFSEDKKMNPSKKFIAFPFSYHEEIEIHITDLNNMGCGVGRKVLSDGSNWVVLVPYTIPGENVICRIYHNHLSYSEADLVRVLEPSPERVSPLCKYFGNCGGCQYQHFSVSGQRKWKQSQVEQLLSRIGGFSVLSSSHQNENANLSRTTLETNNHESSSIEVNDQIVVNPVVGNDMYYFYRAKLTPHYDAPIRSYNDATNEPVTNIQIGFQRRGSRKIVDISDCVIADSDVNSEYQLLREKTKQSLLTPVTISSSSGRQKRETGATLFLRRVDDGVETDPRSVVTQTVNGIAFRFLAGEFFQNNLHVLPDLVAHVLRRATGDGCTRLVDAYCGCGLFALCGAHRFREVWGVEVSAVAIRAARESARINNITNAQFVAGDAGDIFEIVNVQIPVSERDSTVVILDPPRAGCDEKFLKQLFRFHPKKIVYVSCDPATQARDAKIIVNAGYRVVDITPFDLFPQTRHIENVISFIK